MRQRHFARPHASGDDIDPASQDTAGTDGSPAAPGTAPTWPAVVRDETPPGCPGVVTVHRDMAVTCTDDRCHGPLPRAYWYSLHGGFARCREATGDGSCPDCGFGD